MNATDLTATIKIPAETMRELVFGRVPRARRHRLAALVLGLAVAVLTPFAALADNDVPRVTNRVSCDELVSEADVLCSIAFDYESAQEDREERELIRECLERLIPARCGVEVTDLLP